jgi:hypothetical protein
MFHSMPDKPQNANTRRCERRVPSSGRPRNEDDDREIAYLLAAS